MTRRNPTAGPQAAKGSPLPAGAAAAPERWAVQAGSEANATLSIPADARRQRQFDIACAVTVGVPADAVSPWLEVSVHANGLEQWRRRIAARNPGEWDGLDYRFVHAVPVGRALRIVVSVTGQGIQRQSLEIEADEV